VSNHAVPSDPPIDDSKFMSTLFWMAKITTEDTLCQADAMVVRKTPDAVIKGSVAGLESIAAFVSALSQQTSISLWPKI
jgi:hypothetical protein